ncbi:MAG TPA: alpha-1,4-glucan--maltose-1-phosphate maltosyltransferase [Bryobacteraceae bacterium]|nr:alpha-1,4-glucan--maltose-1-phosphate maltosyltransferase [Bryobacteraceae bacterium]
MSQQDGRKRVVIEGVKPEINAGRFAAKRVLGDLVRVEADIFTDGHDAIAAVLVYKHQKEDAWLEQAMQLDVNDRWQGEFPVSELGRYQYTLHAWVDHFETWRRDLLKRIAAEQDTLVDYLIGADLVEAAAKRAIGTDKNFLLDRARLLKNDLPPAEKRTAATADDLNQAMRKSPDRTLATTYERTLEIIVDPVLGRFSAWYELFPRSTSPVPGEHGTFNTLSARLESIAGLGFDIVYLPPIHPIGVHFRKGKNNSQTADAADTGSPWAIGGVEGGHKSIHPQLGTIDDFRRLVALASNLGLKIALDIAFQSAPDHPYVKEHENWFKKRPDGTIQYAENPPKKYQDIYPFDFETSDWQALWDELKSVFLFWIGQGVRVFRVDNPHTKPFPFWEWVITEIKRDYPDVLFLSEAFTRPKIMYRLAKLGFSQSYTYFPWRNTKGELTAYLTELTKTDVREFFRPSQWTNTPDILTEFLQTGGRPAFLIRLILASTMGASYGIYGPAFELLEGRPLRPGSEEYLDSEKYQIREWNLSSSDNLSEIIGLVNRARRENPALQNDWSIQFHATDNDDLLCYSKQSSDGENIVLVIVNLNPHYTHSGFVNLDLDLLKIESDHPFQVHDQLTGARYIWHGPRNFVQLNPQSMPAHIFRVRKRFRTETDFEYFL